MKIKSYHWVILCAGVSVVWFFLLQGNIYSPLEGSTPTKVGERDVEVQKAKIGDGVFLLRVARTEGERARGLGGTQALAQNEGMLFIFPTDALHAIWMKDMLIPIDIVWLLDNGEVIDARENVSLDTFPSIFTPKFLARFVVELPAGSVKTFAVTIGSRAEFFPQ